MIDIREPEAKTALREQLSVSYHKNFWQEFATTYVNDEKVVRWLFDFLLEEVVTDASAVDSPPPPPS